LFNLFLPTHAFFGQKDAQQLLIIQAMVEQLNYQVTIIPCETIREQNGLAMSSRNSHLSAQQKMEASKIYHALVDAKSVILNGETNVLKIKQNLFDALNSIPNSKIVYISIANINTLIEVETEVKGTVLISLAVYVGKVRLIDNIICS
jgi:pantoate--beta-alanine ligase